MDQEQDRSARGLELVGASGLAFDRAALLANLGSIDIEQSRADRAEGNYAEVSATARPLGCPPGRSPGDRPIPPTPTASPTPEPLPPTPDTTGPPAPTILGPTNNLRIPCGTPASVSLSWEAPGDPSGIDSYRVRLQEFGADFSGERVFDPVATSQLDVSIETGCGKSYRWSVLARDGAGNQGVASDWAYFDIDSATPAPTILGPTDYRHLSCVAQIILRWEAPDDPDGIFGYQVSLQTVLGVGYGEAQTFGWMVSTQKDVSRWTDCNSTYRWRVFASDQLLNQGLWSDWAYFIVNPPGE